MQKKMIFTLVDEENRSVSGRIEVHQNGLSIFVGGYGNCSMQNGHGQVAALDFWDGKLTALLWPDFNEEENTPTSLEGAREPEEGTSAEGQGSNREDGGDAQGP